MCKREYLAKTPMLYSFDRLQVMSSGSVPVMLDFYGLSALNNDSVRVMAARLGLSALNNSSVPVIHVCFKYRHQNYRADILFCHLRKHKLSAREYFGSCQFQEHRYEQIRLCLPMKGR